MSPSDDQRFVTTQPASHAVFLAPAAGKADEITTMLVTELPGWQLTTCTRVEAAVDYARQSEQPVVLVVDPTGNSQVAWSNGELRTAVSQLVASLPDVPVVVITASHDRGQAVELLSIGAQDVLVARTFGARSLADSIVFAGARADRHSVDQNQLAGGPSHSGTATPGDTAYNDPREAPLTIELELLRAIDAGQLVLHYQPIVDLAQARVVGVEALVRWNHPTRGLIPPGSFIPVAERSGLIVPLGLWVLREACRQAAAWRAQFARLQVGVNFSARQLSAPGLAAVVKQVLRDNGLAPERLLIEITEASLVSDRAAAQETVSKIAELGVEIALDDFGAGSNSISALKGLPIKVLKIDREFVAGVGTDSRDIGIVRAVLGIAHAVGANSLAEGVETLAQLVALRDMGCDMAQGFYFGQPVPSAEIRAMIAHCESRLTS